MHNTDLKKAPSKTLKHDLVLIFTVLLVLCLFGVALLRTQKNGDAVCVRVNGEHYGTYSLHKDAVVEIVTEAGYNRLVIQDGVAFMEEADCPDGICTAHRPIDGTRECITCLPHGVVISVLREMDTDAPDVILGMGGAR